MNSHFSDYLLKITNSSKYIELEIIQSLWSNYGKISRYQLDSPELETVVIKFINLSKPSTHPRGWNTSTSHQRKVKSYEIETHWYEEWSQDCNTNCRIPKLIGSFENKSDQWIILEDLNPTFPLRKYDLNIDEVKVCLKWLANFHGTFMGREPKGLWKVGTYWNLETRPDEWKLIAHAELKSKAHLIDDLLNQCKHQTIVHGDAKLANFCFSENGEQVAAVDFQYVGGGCGMKDVAYFLGSCLSGGECKRYEDELLSFYFTQLESAINFSDTKNVFEDLEEEWRRMYPIACTDFNRFLFGWMPTHQKLNAYNMSMMEEVLAVL